MGVKYLQHVALNSAALLTYDITKPDFDSIYVDLSNLEHYLYYHTSYLANFGGDEQTIFAKLDRFIEFLKLAQKPIYLVAESYTDESRFKVQDHRDLQKRKTLQQNLAKAKFDISIHNMTMMNYNHLTSTFSRKNLNKLRGVTVISYMGEADTYIAYKCQHEKCLVISSDSDLLISNYNGYNMILETLQDSFFTDDMTTSYQAIDCNRFICRSLGFTDPRNASYLAFFFDSDITLSHKNYSILAKKTLPAYILNRNTPPGHKFKALAAFIANGYDPWIKHGKNLPPKTILSFREEHYYPTELAEYELYNPETTDLMPILVSAQKQKHLDHTPVLTGCLDGHRIYAYTRILTEALNKIRCEFLGSPAAFTSEMLEFEALFSHVAKLAEIDISIEKIREETPFPETLSRQDYYRLHEILSIFNVVYKIRAVYDIPTTNCNIYNLYSLV